MRKMTDKTRELMAAAHDARMKLRYGAMSYEEAKQIAGRFIDHCNKGAERIAKEFGSKVRLMNARSFLR